jgi:hypothetical protein
MAAKNAAFLNRFVNGPYRAGVPLFPFLFPIARHTTAQFQSSETAPHLKTSFPLRRSRFNSPGFFSKSLFRKRDFGHWICGIVSIPRACGIMLRILVRRSALILANGGSSVRFTRIAGISNIRGALHRKPRPVQYVGVDHSGSNIRMTQ